MFDYFPSPQPVRISAVADADDEDLAARSVARLLITAATSQQVEDIARRIHMASVRADCPFVQTRARDLPRAVGMLRATCSGILDAAAGGSVLLSDVEEMPRSVQDRLISLLEQLERQRDPSDAVRLVSGSTVPLMQRVRAGRFSAKLFYRLNVIHVVAE